MSDTLRPGQTWECDEARANPEDVPEPHDVVLWEDLPRFKAVVDTILDGVAELTVATGNTHPRTPEFGATIDVHENRLRDKPRWGLRE